MTYGYLNLLNLLLLSKYYILLDRKFQEFIFLDIDKEN